MKPDFNNAVNMKLIFCCTLFLSAAASASYAERLLDPMPPTMQAHEFTLPAISGENLTLSDLQGKFVLVNFWSTRCTVCRAELTTLQDLYDQMKANSDFEILAIHAGSDIKGVQEQLKINSVTYPMLMDMDLEMGHWGIPTLPTSYLITPDGNFAYRALGTRVWNSPSMVDFLREIFRDYEAAKAPAD